MCSPGQSHHGRPIKVLDYGTTGVDHATFLEYVQGLRSVWTADAYHLIDQNCNNFSNEVVAFLVGKTIPQDILDLPTDFLATPLGASLRPMIDSMFRGGPATSNQSLSNGSLPNGVSPVLDSVVSSATARPAPPSGTSSLTSHLTLCTTPAHFASLLSTHRIVVANFTNEKGCPPCRAIAPTFAQIAREVGAPSEGAGEGGRKKKERDAEFVVVDANVAGELAAKYGIRATPTFKFFLDGKEVLSLLTQLRPRRLLRRRVSAGRRAQRSQPGRAQVASRPDPLLRLSPCAFSRAAPQNNTADYFVAAHPHSTLKVPTVSHTPPSAVRYAQLPNPSALFSKLSSAFSTVPPSPQSEQAKTTFSADLPSLLEDPQRTLGPTFMSKWDAATVLAIKTLPPADLFPVVDLLRIGSLNPSAAGYWAVSSSDVATHPVLALLATVNKLDPLTIPRPLALTSLRLFSNSLLSPPLAQLLLAAPSHRGDLTSFGIGCLLSSNPDVRTAAASLVWGLVGWWSRGRNRWVDVKREEAEEEGWEVEVETALIEGLQREDKNPDVGTSSLPSSPSTLALMVLMIVTVHRLVATLAHLFFLSPYATSALGPLAKALDLDQTLDQRKTLLGVKEQDLVHDLRTLLKASEGS